MISARVPSDCIVFGNEDANSHDSTLSHGVIKLRLPFFILNVHPLAAKMTYCTFKLTIKLLQTFILWCMPGPSNHLLCLNRCKLTFRRASHISESNQLPMDWTNSLPYIFSYSDVITVRNICCYFSFIMLLNTIVLNYFRISRATLDYICQALKAWAKISSVSSWLFTLKSHYEKSDAYPVYFHMWKRPRMEWSDSFTLIQKQICITHQGKNSAVWM